MSDRRPILPTGSGMPYVSIADSQGQQIIDPLTGYSLGEMVTSFSYNYREEDDDECKITVQCSNADLIDIPQLREQQYISVQWGIMYSNSEAIISPIRKVMIRKTTLDLTPQNIIIHIEGTDGASILKAARAAQNKQGNFVEWLKENLTGNYRFRTYIEDVSVVEPESSFASWVVRYGSHSYSPTIGHVGLNYNAPTEGFRGLKEVEPDKLLKQRTFTQIGGNNPYLATKDQLAYLEDGPYHMDCRDDEINIHPTNFNQAPIAEYTWKQGAGEVLNFKIEVRKKRKPVDITRSSNIDPLTKSLDTSAVQSSTNIPDLSVDGITGAASNTRYLADTATTSERLSQSEELLRQYAPEYVENLIKSYEQAQGDPFILSTISADDLTIKVKAKVKEKMNLGSDTRRPGVGFESRQKGWQDIKRDENIIIVKKDDGTDYDYWENPEVIVEKEIDVVLSARDLLGYAGDADSSILRAFSEVNDNMQKAIEGSLTLVGQPFLTSSKIIKLNNISKKYSGDWYIKEIAHEVTPGKGYTSKLNLIKKTSASGSIIQSQVKTNTPNLARQIQDVVAEVSDPAAIAQRELNQKQIDKILKEYKDYGQLKIYTDETGKVVRVDAEKDWVSLNKATDTDELNRNDAQNKNIVRDKN